MTSESLFDLVRFDTKSSIDSNATAPNLPGPGRTVGLLFDWLGTRLENVLNNRVSNLRHDPDTIAQNIRQLCRHNERSIVQRHHSPRFDLTAVEKKHLKKLCNKLIKSAARSRLLPIQMNALEEIINLTIEDPLIRTVLVGCDLRSLAPKYNEPNLIISTVKAFGSVEYAHVHELWSGVIYRAGAYDHLCLAEDTVINALCRSLTVRESSYLAARYFYHVIRVGIHPRDDSGLRFEYYCFYKVLWQLYFDIADRHPEVVEWSNFNSCISYFTRESFLGIDGFIDRFGNFAQIFAQNLQETQSIIEKFLLTPTIEYNNVEDNVTITQVSDWILDNWWCCSFAVAFLRYLSGSEDVHAQLLFIRGGMDPGSSTRRELRSTIFGNEAYIAYCNMLYLIESKELQMDTVVQDGWTFRSRSRSHTWSKFSFWAKVLMSSYNHAKSMDEKATSMYLIGRFMSIDRYCKLAMFRTTRPGTRTRFFLSPSISRPLIDAADEYRDLMKRAYFSEGYLIRLRVGENIYLMDGTYNKQVLCRILKKHVCGHLAMDIMFIDSNMRMWHRLTVSAEKPYDPTGHYPVLAGFNGSGEPLYVTRFNRHSYFSSILACVTNGDAVLEFHEQNQCYFISSHFCVLSLRHDPSDMQPPYPSTPEGAKDPTGPLHWLEFWPKKDPDFPSEHCIRHKLDSLEMVLNTFSQSADPMDSEAERGWKLLDAMCRADPGNAFFWGQYSIGEEWDVFFDEIPKNDVQVPATNFDSSKVDRRSGVEDSLDSNAGSGSNLGRIVQLGVSQSSGDSSASPEDFTSNLGATHTAGLDESQASGIRCATPDGELGVGDGDVEAENWKLKEELRQTQGELCHMRELVASMQAEGR